MCGDLDDDAGLGEELLDRLKFQAQLHLKDEPADRRAALGDAPGDTALHLYMDALFADLLRACIADAEGVAAASRADVLAAQPVVLARLAGMLAGLFPPGAETLKSGLEALMDGYGARPGPAPGHHH